MAAEKIAAAARWQRQQHEKVPLQDDILGDELPPSMQPRRRRSRAAHVEVSQPQPRSQFIQMAQRAMVKMVILLAVLLAIGAAHAVIAAFGPSAVILPDTPPALPRSSPGPALSPAAQAMAHIYGQAVEEQQPVDPSVVLAQQRLEAATVRLDQAQADATAAEAALLEVEESATRIKLLSRPAPAAWA